MKDVLEILFKETPKSLLLMTNDVFEPIGENLYEARPDKWDIHTDIDNLYLVFFYADNKEADDVELHIPMENVIAVKATGCL